MTAHTFYAVIIPAANTVGAAWAVWCNVRAAYIGRPSAARLRLIVALMAAAFGLAYATLWTGLVTDRAAWSSTVAILSSLSWWVAWAEPARQATRSWAIYQADIHAATTAAVDSIDEQP